MNLVEIREERIFPRPKSPLVYRNEDGENKESLWNIRSDGIMNPISVCPEISPRMIDVAVSRQSGPSPKDAQVLSMQRTAGTQRGHG